MAGVSAAAAQLDIEGEESGKKLHHIFLDSWKAYDELEVTQLASNSFEFQSKVKDAMKHFETATVCVSQLGVFSSNEFIDEVSTEDLQYMLLPYFLGKLALKLNEHNRLDVLNVAEVYFKDYLQRCQEYELCEIPKKDSDDTQVATSSSNEMAELLRAANARNDKIKQFRQKKELEEKINLMKEAARNNTLDEEKKRDFFLKYIKKGIIDAEEELQSLKLEKQMVEMRNMSLSKGTTIREIEPTTSAALTSEAHHAHDPMHKHHKHYYNEKPKRPPLQPFIITRDAGQKAVFGMSYPSLPVMTVDEFYQQRVEDGIFPDAEKVEKMNRAQAIAAAADPDIKEEEEKAAVEEHVEADDDEYLARMRRMDEYKDVVRRGDGNRFNRS